VPFTYDAIANRVKDDVGSFQFINRVLNNLSYLKQQSEIIITEDATDIDDDKIKPKHLVASNEPVKGMLVVAESNVSFIHSFPWLDPFLRFTLEDD